jgi:hypothetical protein
MGAFIPVRAELSESRAVKRVLTAPDHKARQCSRVAIALLAVLYGASVVLLFADRVREFADESDNLLGGLLLTHGSRLYADYFSSHMPLAYYVAAIPAGMGATRLEEFRLFTNAALVLVTLAIVWGLRHRLSPVVLSVWALMTVFAHNLQWGAMLTAGTCAAFGAFVTGLLVFTTPRLQFGPRAAFALTAAIFVAVQSELISIFPLLVLAVAYVGVRLNEARRTSFWAEGRRTAILALIVAAPHVLVIAGLWATGALPDFIYDAFQFNETYYAQYLMNPSVLGMLRDWQAQYRTYVLESVGDPLGVEACLIVSNALAAWLSVRRRGPLVGVLYYLFVALTHVRVSGMYYVCSYFSLALLAVWAAGVLSRRDRVLIPSAALALALIGVFVVLVGRGYDFSKRPPRTVPEVALIRELTTPGDRIFVGPYDPYIYLAAERLPASTLPFYFPWQAIDPRSEGKLLADLRTARPPVIVFRRDELVNDRWSPRVYGTRVLEFVDAEYEPVDPASPVLSTVFVRRDRTR